MVFVHFSFFNHLNLKTFCTVYTYFLIYILFNSLFRMDHVKNFLQFPGRLYMLFLDYHTLFYMGMNFLAVYVCMFCIY